jgi:hypothetical protein
MQVFPPTWIRDTGFTGETLHPGVTLEGVAVVCGEDEYNMVAVLKGIHKELFIFGLRAPGALTLCCLDVLVVPTFDEEVSDIVDSQVDTRLGRANCIQ